MIKYVKVKDFKTIRNKMRKPGIEMFISEEIRLKFMKCEYSIKIRKNIRKKYHHIISYSRSKLIKKYGYKR